MFKRILVATDDSARSRRAVTRAIELAAQSQAELVALMVVPRKALDYFDGICSPGADAIHKAEASACAAAHTVLSSVVQQAALSKLQVRVEAVVSDRVADVIVDASLSHQSDLIVMGSSGRNWLLAGLGASKTQLVLGSSRLQTLLVH